MVSARPEDDEGHGEEERVGRDLVEIVDLSLKTSTFNPQKIRPCTRWVAR
jgi:hypothetical protein